MIKVDRLPEGFEEYSNVYDEDAWQTPQGAYLMRRIYLKYNRSHGLDPEDVVVYFRDGWWRMGVRKSV